LNLALNPIFCQTPVSGSDFIYSKILCLNNSFILSKFCFGFLQMYILW
jgi:hypothetical protein